MEEVVWKNIDDLAFNRHLHLPTANSTTVINHHHHHHDHASLLDFLSLSTSPTKPKDDTNPHQIPLTALTLSLGPSCNYIEPNLQVNNNSSTNNKSNVGVVAALPSLRKKRPPTGKGETSDQRHRRLMKNRESSARSREKKQAHKDDLEKELDSLRMENAKLRRWLAKEKLRQTTPVDIPNWHKLHRTLTAPF